MASFGLPGRSTGRAAIAIVIALALAACGDDPSQGDPFPPGLGGPLDAGSSPVQGGGDGSANGDGSLGGGDGSDSADGSEGNADGDSAIPGEVSSGCGETKLPPISDDVGVRGPWKVGVRTVQIGRLTVEVVYPAKPGTTDGLEVANYDIRDWLPEQERSKVPDENVPLVTALDGDLYRDVPIDDSFGPYPVVIFIHGTSSFRIASGSTNAHWASRGFIVLAADYPGLGLKDQLSATLECALPGDTQDIPADVDAQLAALNAPAGDLAFLAGRVDMERIGISGHSQGGCVSSTFTNLPGVRIILPLSGSTAADPSPTLESIMYVAGMDDRVIGYHGPWVGNVVCPLGSISTKSAYELSPGAPEVKKRIVGIEGGGHLVVTDLCQKNSQGRNAIEEANEQGVCGINSAVIIGLPYLFDCGSLEMESGIRATNYATTAALEETLHCKDRSAAFGSLTQNLPQVGEFLETVQ